MSNRRCRNFRRDSTIVACTKGSSWIFTNWTYCSLDLMVCCRNSRACCGLLSIGLVEFHITHRFYLVWCWTYMYLVGLLCSLLVNIAHYVVVTRDQSTSSTCILSGYLRSNLLCHTGGVVYFTRSGYEVWLFLISVLTFFPRWLVYL